MNMAGAHRLAAAGVEDPDQMARHVTVWASSMETFVETMDWLRRTLGRVEAGIIAELRCGGTPDWAAAYREVCSAGATVLLELSPVKHEAARVVDASATRNPAEPDSDGGRRCHW